MIKRTTASNLSRSESIRDPFLDRKPDPDLSADEGLQPLRYFRGKYVAERLIALVLLLPALPVIFILCVIVRMSSQGPAIYRQKRVGMLGRDFEMFKIRTMSNDAEAKSGPLWCSRNDPRITQIGHWLRLLHLDELPQLFNVVRGDMTIIGPRPERPDFVNILSEQIDGYMDRLAVKPGITGLAQIYLPPDETIDCVRRKVCFDRVYIRTATPLVDLQIWMCTIVRILGLRQGRGPRWFGLDRRYQNVKKTCMMVDEPPVPKTTRSVRRPKFSKVAMAEPVSGHNLHDSSGILLDEFPDNPIQNRTPRQPR